MSGTPTLKSRSAEMRALDEINAVLERLNDYHGSRRILRALVIMRDIPWDAIYPPCPRAHP